MNDDAELLRQYADHRSEPAFAELVRRHLGLVYHAALRQTGGDVFRAQDVTQEVFTSLARKARTLAQRPTLAGWLHTSTRYAALQAVRSERRRQNREQEIYAMTDTLHPADTSDAGWERLKPFVDEALHALNERDREAVLLRFFEGRPFAEVGAKLAVSEDAARVRVDRALEKLRATLTRHGVTSTAAALSVALGTQAGAAVPAGLAATVTNGALVAGGTSSLLFTLMNLSKLKVALALGAVAVGATTVAVQQHRDNETLRAEVAHLSEPNPNIDKLSAENARLKASLAQQESLRKDDTDLIELMGEESGMKAKVIEAVQKRANSSEAVVARLTARLAEVSPYDASELDRAVERISTVGPIYPSKLKEAGVDGEVQVECTIDKEGAVQDVKVVRSSHREFEAPTIEALRQWKFKPGEKGGRAVSARVQQLMVFQHN